MATISDTRHPEYEKNISMWERCRDNVEGEKAVKDGGIKYLPVQGVDVAPDSDEYLNYKNRAYFYGMSGNTVDALVGLAFREEPEMNPEDWGNAKYIEANADGAGTPLRISIKNTLTDVVTTGRGGLLTDYPSTEGETTAADDKDRAASVHYYPAESIVNWGISNSSGSTKLEFVVLKEERNVGVELWEWELNDTYRLLRIDENGYVVGLLYDDAGVPIGEEYEIVAGGERLTEIPFFIISESGDWKKVSTSPILKIVDTNVAHYRVSAEMSQCMHLHSNPIPYGTGMSQQDIERLGEVALGGEMLLFETGTFDLKQINFESSGYRNVLNDYVSRGIELGARLVTPQSGGVESAEAIRLRQAGDISTMASIVMSVTTAYEKAIQVADKFMGGSGDINVEISLNNEVVNQAPDGALLTAFVGLLDRSVIGSDIIREYLRSVKVIAKGMTDEKIEETINDSSNGTLFTGGE